LGFRVRIRVSVSFTVRTRVMVSVMAIVSCGPLDMAALSYRGHEQ